MFCSHKPQSLSYSWYRMVNYQYNTSWALTKNPLKCLKGAKISKKNTKLKNLLFVRHQYVFHWSLNSLLSLKNPNWWLWGLGLCQWVTDWLLRLPNGSKWAQKYHNGPKNIEFSQCEATRGCLCVINLPVFNKWSSVRYVELRIVSLGNKKSK